MYEINKSYEQRNFLNTVNLNKLNAYLRITQQIIVHHTNHIFFDLCFWWFIPFPRRDNCGVPRDPNKPHIKKLWLDFSITAINSDTTPATSHHIMTYFKEYPPPFVIIALDILVLVFLLISVLYFNFACFSFFPFFFFLFSFHFFLFSFFSSFSFTSAFSVRELAPSSVFLFHFLHKMFFFFFFFWLSNCRYFSDRQVSIRFLRTNISSSSCIRVISGKLCWILDLSRTHLDTSIVKLVVAALINT